MRRDLSTHLNRLIAEGSKNKEAATIRSDPTSCGWSPINPFLIRINELPQIKAKVSKSTQARRGDFCMINYWVVSDKTWLISSNLSKKFWNLQQSFLHLLVGFGLHQRGSCRFEILNKENITIVEKEYLLNHIIETCQNTLISFQNDFWLTDDGFIWKSKQWIPKKNIYVLINLIKDSYE